MFFIRKREPNTQKYWEKAWENILTNKKWKDGEKIKVCNFDKKTENKKNFKKTFSCQKERFFLSEKENQRPKNIEKKHEKTYWQTKMKGWQRRSKFATLIKNREEKQKKNWRKFLHVN